jgi:hypothetical protein
MAHYPETETRRTPPCNRPQQECTGVMRRRLRVEQLDFFF